MGSFVSSTWLEIPGIWHYISTSNEVKSVERKTINVFRALGEPNRIRILKMLEEREL